MTNIQTFATHSFSAYASKNIRIDQDNSGLFAMIPDQSGCNTSRTLIRHFLRVRITGRGIIQTGDTS
jgi:hypothetical protein